MLSNGEETHLFKEIPGLYCILHLGSQHKSCHASAMQLRWCLVESDLLRVPHPRRLWPRMSMSSHRDGCQVSKKLVPTKNTSRPATAKSSLCMFTCSRSRTWRAQALETAQGLLFAPFLFLFSHLPHQLLGNCYSAGSATPRAALREPLDLRAKCEHLKRHPSSL